METRQPDWSSHVKEFFGETHIQGNSSNESVLHEAIPGYPSNESVLREAIPGNPSNESVLHVAIPGNPFHARLQLKVIKFQYGTISFRSQIMHISLFPLFGVRVVTYIV